MSGIGFSRHCVGVWGGMLLVGALQTSAWGQFPPRGAYRGFNMRGPFGELRVEVERPMGRRALPMPVPAMPVPASPRAAMRAFMAESMARSMRGMGFPGPGFAGPGFAGPGFPGPVAGLRLEIESRLAEPTLGREPGPAFEVPGYEDVERAAADATARGTRDGLAARRLQIATRDLRRFLLGREDGDAWTQYLQLDAVEQFAEQLAGGVAGATFDMARDAERLVAPLDAVSRSPELGWLTREVAFQDLRRELARWSFSGSPLQADKGSTGEAGVPGPSVDPGRGMLRGESNDPLGASVLERTAGEANKPVTEDAAGPEERNQQIEELPLPVPDSVVPKQEPKQSVDVPFRGDA